MAEFPPPSLRPLAEEVAALLTAKGKSLCVAETACGGLISATLLSIPGASKFYKGGLTLYTLPSRILYGGWTTASVQSYTGPTTEIVVGLAGHARRQLEADYAVGESGTAGPTGGSTRNRRPGFVAVGVAGPDGVVARERETGHGRRDENMVEFAAAALELLRDVLRENVRLESKV